MAITLRPYQQQAVDAAVTFFKGVSKNNSIEILPTGSGKSVVIAGIIRSLNEKTLILQPSKEILVQNFQKYRTYGFYASVYSASLGRKEISNTVFATIGSIVKKPSLFSSFKYIIIDECHLVNAKGGMYDDFLSALSHCKVLGLTATPYRLSSDGFGGSILKFITRTRPRIFKKVIYYIQNKELFYAGYLCPVKYYQIGKFDRSQIKKNTTGADYNEVSLQKYYNKIDLAGSLVVSVKRLMQIRRNILVFVRYVKEAKALMDALPGSEIVTGDMSDDKRDDILRRFKSGSLQTLINIGVVAIGFDKPDLETIVLGRETMSLALYYQWVGRGIRPHADKKECWVVDHCANYSTFGKIEDLTIEQGENEKWVITSNGLALTNEYFGEVYVPPGDRTLKLFR